MNKKILLYVALMAVMLYVMPNTISLFAGQHTFYSEIGITCEKCHSDVLVQLQAGASYEKHRVAAANVNYTTYLSLGGTAYSDGTITAYDGKIWTWNGNTWQNGNDTRKVSLDENNNGIIDGNEICMLCHNSTLTGSITHTDITVRVCDDDRCHGNRNNLYINSQLLRSTSNITATGYSLGQANTHQSFYLAASNQPSSYGVSMAFGQPGNANGSFISKGYWACEGCHTDTGTNVNIIPAPAFNHSVSNPDKKRYN